MERHTRSKVAVVLILAAPLLPLAAYYLWLKGSLSGAGRSSSDSKPVLRSEFQPAGNGLPAAVVPESLSPDVVAKVSPVVSNLANKAVQEIKSRSQIQYPLNISEIIYHRINHQEQDIIAAHVTIGGMVLEQRIYLFDEQTGDLLFDSGREHESVSDARLTTLGTDADWFLWLMSWEPKDPDGDGLIRVSSLIPIDGTFATAVEVAHRGNDVAYSSTPDQAKALGFPGLMFTTADPESDRAEGTPSPDPPNVQWDQQKRVFVAKREFSYEQTPVYRINVDRSAAFQESD